MNRRILAVCLLALVIPASAQGVRTRRPSPLIVLPPCDPSKLIDLLDEFYEPAPTPPLAPEYCAPRTCEAKTKAVKYAKDAELLHSIDLMRRSCRTYFP